MRIPVCGLRENSRLLGDDELVELSRPVLVVLLVPQNGRVTLLHELLRNVAMRRAQIPLAGRQRIDIASPTDPPVSTSVSNGNTLLLIVVPFLGLDVVDVNIDGLSDELFSQESM